MIIPVMIPVADRGAKETDHIMKMDLAALRDHARQLEKRLDRYALAFAATTELIRQTTGESEEEILARFKTIMNEKATAPLRTCEQCGRTIGAKKTSCMYCGAVAKVDSVSDLLK